MVLKFALFRLLFYYYYHYFMLKYCMGVFRSLFYYYYHYFMLKYSWVFLVSPCYCSTLVCSALLCVSPCAVYWSWCCACLSLRLWLRGLWQPCCCSESRQRSEDQRSSGSDGKGKHTPVPAVTCSRIRHVTSESVRRTHLSRRAGWMTGRQTRASQEPDHISPLKSTANQLY